MKKNPGRLRGLAGDNILYIVILGGIVVAGYLLVGGSSVPGDFYKQSENVVVTLIPKKPENAKPNQQLYTFTGVTGMPTSTPTPTPPPPPPIDPNTSGTTCSSSAGTPSAPISGYHLTKCEDFNETSMPGTYSPYNGGGGSTVVGGGRKASQCTVGNGVLTLSQTADGSTCGGTMSSFGQKYGYWEVRMRAYSTGSGGSAPHPVLILWPDTDRWADGELDYFEANIGSGMNVYLHCVGNPSSNCYHTTNGVDFSQWHVYGFEWTAAGFTGYIDGKQIYTTSGNGSNPNVSMHETIQLDNLTGRTPVSPGKMEVDWVHMYSQ